jgi:2-dehydro-3-deoxyglucarate aldolase/4-hydroxy-2-oxoheptanedioate aldolase
MKNAMKFREKLQHGQVCFGVGITFYDPTVTDALCPLFDFVWIDMEHNALTLEAVQSHIMATQGTDTTAIVRVPSHDPNLIKTVLDVGADGIIVPNVRSAEEAHRTVAACRYPPEGIRGYGPRRPSGYGRTGGSAFCKAANQAIIAIAQIEHIDAVRDIDRILAVPGLDSIVFGPNDLSGSMGHMGEPQHPEVVKAMESVVTKAKRTKVAIGSGIGDHTQTEYWLKQGAHWMLAAGDISLMLGRATEMMEQQRKLAEKMRQPEPVSSAV